MFSSTAKAAGDNPDATGTSRVPADLSLRMDYYGGDFVEDGSFLVLNTDGMSLSPNSPAADRSEDEEVPDKNVDIEVLNEAEDDDTPYSSVKSGVQQQQVLGEDPESSVESGHSASLQAGDSAIKSSGQPEVGVNSLTNLSVASMSSGSTDAHLIESGEDLNLLMEENKKLTELLADSNEKMKVCITTTEKLKADHEEYKKKNEASREIINQLRQDNEMLKSQVSLIKSQSQASSSGEAEGLEKELACKQESLQRESHTISELNERLNTVLTYNGTLNDQLLTSQKNNQELREEVERIQTDRDTVMKQIGAMKEEIEAGRKAVAKFSEHQLKMETELANAKANISTLEAIVEEKTKLTESLRRNMEDTVTALERRNQKLNQKEQEISLLTTKLAALNAESESASRLQALEFQCQKYRQELEQVREERAKLTAEKDLLLVEVNVRTEELKKVNDTLENYRRLTDNGDIRNDNSADNANESLPSPLTSLPSVAGQFVGFVRRELLGWEDHAGAIVDTNQSTSEGAAAAATVVQQPKQDAIPPCPICRKTFASLERLQTHASNCGIENDDGQPDDPFVFP